MTAQTKKVKKKGFLASMEPRKRKLFYIYSTVIVCVLACIIFILSGLPSLDELENPTPQFATRVLDINGELIGQFYVENRIETNIDSLPPHLLNALIATEDRKFYDHWGVDLDRFVKAMFKNIFTFSREGASTITQQLSKNLYQLKEKSENVFQTGVRKIREWITAVQIERNFTKREILQLYLDVSYFGKSAYGIETAAKIYFGKRAKNLTVPEAALLVALLKSSVVYDPERKAENAIQRRNVVMYNMVKTGYLSEADYENYKKEPIKLAKGNKVNLKSDAPYFLEFIRQEMEKIATKYGLDLYSGGLTVYSTLDIRMQQYANKAVAEHLRDYQAKFNKYWNWERNKYTLNVLIEKAVKNLPIYREANSQSEKAALINQYKADKEFVDSVKKAESTVQAGFVVVEAGTGHIKAMVGGANQDFAYGLNHVTQIRRQPGSSFKPFTYLTALLNGLSPSTQISNDRFTADDGWSPANSDGEYGGMLTLREALAKSVNVVAARLTTNDEYAPPKQVAKLARKMGIESPLGEYPSIALGTSEVSPLEMTAAYATIANKGIYIKPIPILRVEDKNGITIEEFRPEIREAVSKAATSLLVDMMQGVVNYGTGARVRQYFSRTAAGKTGTTQDYADAWFMGFTPQLVAGSWVGFDDRRVRFNNADGQGARAALPIWGKFMGETYKNIPMKNLSFDLPSGIQQMELCKEQLLQGHSRLANTGCPSTVFEYILSENPPRACEIHGGSAKSERADENPD